MSAPEQYVSVRYIDDDVAAAIDFHTTHLGFSIKTSVAPGSLTSCAARCGSCCPDPASSGARATPR